MPSIPSIPSMSSKDDACASHKKCMTCGEDKPITKFKTNSYDKDGNRTRMITCRDCTEAKKASAGTPKPASPPRDGCSSKSTSSARSMPSLVSSNGSSASSTLSSQSEDMVRMKKLQSIECAINAIKDL